MHTDSRSTLARRLEAIPTDTLFDALDDFGLGATSCLDNRIAPLVNGRSLAGPVYTIRLVRDPRTPDQWAPPDLQTITHRFEGIEPGDVLLVDGAGDTAIGHWGEVLSRIALRYGARGVVVDGGTRDSRGLRSLEGWTVFARFTSPVESIGRMRFHEVDVPLFLTGALGPVTVTPNDWVVADEDGILLIPATDVDRVLERAEEIEAADDAAKASLAAGEDIEDVYRRYRRA